MKKKNSIYNLLGLAIAALIIGTTCPASAQKPSGAKNIVIVHGAFADASGWEAVHKILNSHGYHVTLVQNPTSSLAADVAATNFVLERQDGPVVLVGHSYGGAVITQAGSAEIVKSLVYVAAVIPDVGESTSSLVSNAKPLPIKAISDPDSHGNVYLLKKTFRETFASGQTQEKADFMCDSQIPLSVVALTDKVTQAPWKNKPTYAVKPSNDQTMSPSLEDMMYHRAKAKITNIKGGHTLFMTQPEAVAKVIEQAANDVK